MNINDLFEKFSIEEINKKTKISPIALRYIKNKEFTKIQRVKFIGFVRIIEKEFNIDLSELIEEYNQATQHTDTTTQNEPAVELKEPKKHNTLILLILAIVLFAIGAYLLYKQYESIKGNPAKTISNNYLPLEKNSTNESTDNVMTTENSFQKETNKTSDKNSTLNETSNKQNTSQHITSKDKKALPKTIEIYPNEKVWFKAINLDNNKTVQYLTSNPKTLNGGNWYIKFGHGNITISYGNQTITPKTKKIVRILFKNGKIKFLKKPNRYEQ